MKKEHKDSTYTLYRTEGKEDELFCKELFESFGKGGDVTLWIDADGKVDGIKIWKKGPK